MQKRKNLSAPRAAPSRGHRMAARWWPPQTRWRWRCWSGTQATLVGVTFGAGVEAAQAVHRSALLQISLPLLSYFSMTPQRRRTTLTGHWASLCSSVGKESVGNAGDSGLISGSGRSPGEGNGNPLQYSCLENSMDRGDWQATVHGVARVRPDLATKPPTTTTNRPVHSEWIFVWQSS